MGILEEVLQEYGEQDKVIIRNPGEVEKALQQIISGGPGKLQVLTDFDFTLTRFHKNGERCVSCHGILDYNPLMSEEYRQKSQRNLKKYYSIEIDPNITIEEKIPYMVEWYKISHQLLAEERVSRSMITKLVEVSNAVLRDSAYEVLSFFNDNKVPVLIFSAGIGDFVEAVLHRDKAFFPNIKVVSNYMDFNEKGECVAFKDPLIHMFNKNETGLAHSSYFQEISKRGNVLLLGDSLGDVNMHKGLHNPQTILKIGFLNDKIEERKESFINSFDIVLLDDQSFRLVDIIARRIASS